MRVRPRWALVALVTLFGARPAQAWEGIAASNPTWSESSAEYELHEDGSDDVPFSTLEPEVRRAMSDWSDVACTGLEVTYLGTTPDDPRGGDGRFIIGWVESGWTSSSSAIGVTSSRFNSRSLVEADIRMNGVNFTWTTNAGSGSNVNLYSITLHEGGHFYGLGHSDDSEATMYFAYSGGVSALASDDEVGICALYPGDVDPPPDCTSTGCPDGQVCVDAVCVEAPGRGVCEPCIQSSQCGGSADRCLGYPDGSGYCGRDCSSDADCEVGDECFTLRDGDQQCARFVDGEASCTATPSDGCSVDGDCDAGERCDAGECVAAAPELAPLGASCGDHPDCQSNLCLTGVCTQTCQWPAGGCPDGFYCDGSAIGCGNAVCLSGGPGSARVGDPCAQDTACESLYCQRGVCEVPCVPGTVAACPADALCAVGELSCRGACGQSGRLGDACMENADCASGICASVGGDELCTELCGDGNPCPDGYRCMEGSVAICVPDMTDPGNGPVAAPPTIRGGCRVSPGSPAGPWWWVGVALILAMALRRR